MLLFCGGGAGARAWGGPATPGPPGGSAPASGGTKPGCTVIMDDPLPPTNMTPPQQSTCIHEFLMGEIIRQPTSLPSYHLGAAVAAAAGFADVITDRKKENSADEGDDDDGDNSSSDNDDDEASNDGINDDDDGHNDDDLFSDCSMDITELERGILLNASEDNITKNNFSEKFVKINENNDLEVDGDRKGLISSIHFENDEQLSDDLLSSANGIANEASEEEDDDEKLVIVTDNINSPPTNSRHVNDHVDSPSALVDGPSIDDDEIKKEQLIVGEEGNVTANQLLSTLPLSPIQSFDGNSDERGVDDVANHKKNVCEKQQEEEEEVVAAPNKRRSNRLAMKQKSVERRTSEVGSNDRKRKRSREEDNNVEACCNNSETSSLITKSFKASSPEPPTISLPLLKLSSSKTSSSLPASLSPSSSSLLLTSSPPTSLPLSILPPSSCSSSQIPSAANPHTPLMLSSSFSDVAPNERRQTFNHLCAADSRVSCNFLNINPNTSYKICNRLNKINCSILFNTSNNNIIINNTMNCKKSVGSDNVAYSYWNVNGCKVLIKHRYMANNYLSDSMTEVHVKMEYQSHHGREQMTISEMGRIWLALFTKPRIQNVLLARVDACSSKLLEIEKFSLNDINVNFNKSLNQLSAILEKCKRGTYNLHKAYHDTQHRNTMKPQDVVDKHWLSVTANVQSCKQSNKIPYTFDIREVTMALIEGYFGFIIGSQTATPDLRENVV
ncbi:hypothetical protein HELRODRAFT_189400 [Helobdella robusta]|uniref:Little elongation complex subunit 2 C-terminal domain-containing protein n=1 Tax=Helobdella robusta TaxID=6412 RepID=T1FR10_HELRO|nr:hypothetical protein HELRODRAFT_189400 [Helobdella robusta]ESN94468.1 hypothetical protein HELRODRAFT_189400 [Helobdella robusta]